MLQFQKLGNAEWNFKLNREFDMTNDSHLFNTVNQEGYLPLFEGKMIHQFIHQFAQPRYWVNEKNGKAVLTKNDSENQIADYEKFRIGIRAIARNTDERTMISGPVPPNVFCGNSILVSKVSYSNNDLFYLQSILNSFALDFYARQMVSANINMFYIYQLPVPRLTPQDRWYNAIVSRAARLICTTEAFSELWEDVMGNRWSEAKAATQEDERNQLRAELDGVIAHIYGLTEEEFAYVLSTFPIVPQAQKEAALNAYSDVERGRINYIF